jgi:pimeloyl-ACP methyl ester carboxylesterase
MKILVALPVDMAVPTKLIAAVRMLTRLVVASLADPTDFAFLEGVRAAPTLGLTSLAADVASIDAVLNQIHGKKILVGHSYGAAVISGASSGRSDVSALVYSAAGPPFAPGSLASIDPAFFPQFFAQDLPAPQVAALDAAQRLPVPGKESRTVVGSRQSKPSSCADRFRRLLRQRKSCGSSKAWPSAGLPQPAHSWLIQRPAPRRILKRTVN